MELALALPIALLATLVVLGAGLVGVEVVTAHSLARDVARAAALDPAATASDVASRSVHQVGVEIDVAASQSLPGELVTASVRLRSRALAAIGIEAWLPARATMPVEQ